MKDRFLLACQDYFARQRADVQAAGNIRRARVRRETVPAESVLPRLKALGRLIIRNGHNNKPVRVPALNGAEWGHLLRTLETGRGWE